jgi:hypothetical protein
LAETDDDVLALYSGSVDEGFWDGTEELLVNFTPISLRENAVMSELADDEAPVVEYDSRELARSGHLYP